MICDFKNVYIVSLITIILLALIPNLIQIDLREKCDLPARPFIYGEELCPFVNKLSISSNSLLSSIIVLLSSKFTIKATLDGEKLYLKKLAYYYEIDALDSLARTTFHPDKLKDYNVSQLPKSLLSSIYIPFKSKKLLKLRLCPSPKRISVLLAPAIQYYKSQNVTEEQIHFYVWTLLNLNPEPLLIQVLPATDWPVPKYYGSCGRLAAFEDCGERLTEFYHSSWEIRANLSVQLLLAAMKFTFGHPEFAFYFTDVSPDNIVVNGAGEAKFIDLENIIVVDKNPGSVVANSLNATWSLNHSSIDEKCVDFYSCFSFSPDDICSHRYSDHNVFAVCREILDDSPLFLDGFLHSTPQLVRNNFPTLRRLIRECTSPKTNDRFKIANELVHSLSSSLHLISTSS